MPINHTLGVSCDTGTLFAAKHWPNPALDDYGNQEGLFLNTPSSSALSVPSTIEKPLFEESLNGVAIFRRPGLRVEFVELNFCDPLLLSSIPRKNRPILGALSSSTPCR